MLTVYLALVFVTFAHEISAETIEVGQCDPPDRPHLGGFGPRKDVYTTGDVVHYYCDTETFMGGSFQRVCLDTGRWTHTTPFCDEAAPLSEVGQSSTADPADENGAEFATDGLHHTCSSTRGESRSAWFAATLQDPGQMLRVMLFMPPGDVDLEVFLVHTNGSEYSCFKRTERIEQLLWFTGNCREPHNVHARGLRVVSYSDAPLQICELVTHVLVDPHCPDPGLQIENGYLKLSRTSASLVCNRGYTRSRNTGIECKRTGSWDTKRLRCTATNWEVERGSAKKGNEDP